MSTPQRRPSGTATAATVAVVAVVAAVLVVLNLATRGGPGGDPASGPTAEGAASASASAAAYAQVVGTAPDDLARQMLAARGTPSPAPTAPDPGLAAGSRDLAGQAEQLAQESLRVEFGITTFNVLGSQHSAAGGSSPRFGPGTTRARWAVDVVRGLGSSIVGWQEIQLDQLGAVDDAMGGTAAFWPGTALGAAGVPQNLMWDDRVWEATWTGQVTIPFVGTLRPQPVARLRHRETGREIYVMNVHNSPNGRQAERDQALAIEVAALAELRRDGLPVLVVGDFNERDRAFCTVTARTDLVAANGGTPAGPGGEGCAPPAAMRIDWVFASPDAALSGYREDTSPAVRRITDHAVVSAEVTVG